MTKIEGGMRVDYEFLKKGEPRWTNMNPRLLRKLDIKVGATFCMARDTGAVEAAAFDYD